MTEVKKPETKTELKEKLSKLKADLSKAKDARDAEMSKDWVKFAEEIMEKMFDEFDRMNALLTGYVSRVSKNGCGWVMGPQGRRRMLFRMLTESKRILGDAGRRAKNSPIQGLSSEMGVTSGFLVLKETYKYMKHFDIDMKYFSLYCRAVHDANYYDEKYKMVLPAIHIKQYTATYGVHKYFSDTFGFTMNVEPEIELEIGLHEDKGGCFKWDWSIPNLIKILHDCVDLAVKAKHITPEQVDKTRALIFRPWLEKETRRYLLLNYPLLNVPRKELEPVILKALRDAGYDPET